MNNKLSVLKIFLYIIILLIFNFLYTGIVQANKFKNKELIIGVFKKAIKLNEDMKKGFDNIPKENRLSVQKRVEDFYENEVTPKLKMCKTILKKEYSSFFTLIFCKRAFPNLAFASVISKKELSKLYELESQPKLVSFFKQHLT